MGAFTTVFVLFLLLISAASAQAAPPSIKSVTVAKVTTDSAVLKAEISPGNAVTSYRFEYGPQDCLIVSCTSVPAPEGEILAGTSPVPVSFELEGLSAGATYHLRVVAKNEDEEVESLDRTFATYSPPVAGPPDNRAYEQASPVRKNAADARGMVAWAKASIDGERVAFLSTSGIPGGAGEQEVPTYLATRGGSEWSTQGLLPPATLGTEAYVRGWLPDFSQVFDYATDFGVNENGTLIVRSGDGSLKEIVGHGEGLSLDTNYVGASADGSKVVFEADAKLACCPQAVKGKPNVYLWDRESDEISLVSVLNDKSAPKDGSFAGPYDWMRTVNLPLIAARSGPANAYTQDLPAVSAAGDAVYFTAATGGELYERINPSGEQSPLDSEGKCTDPALACTLEISASHRTVPDPLGLRPAAFMAATADGSSAFFASPEELTNDANTGPDQPQPAIQRAAASGPPIDKDFPITAAGVAVDSEHIYWANTQANSIGRLDLDGSNAKPAFIVVPDLKVKNSQGEEEEVPAEPQYVAVDSGHIYWTNAPKEHLKEGTIGRTDIAGTPGSVDAEWITGARNPKGIAVNAEFVYWANGGAGNTAEGTIGRAKKSDGEEVNQAFIPGNFTLQPQGVALDTGHIYWSTVDAGVGGSIRRIDLDGKTNEIFEFISTEAQLRSVAVDAGHVYWASQGDEAIGRVDLDLETNKDRQFIPLAGKPKGLALDAAQTDLFWSLNGESVPNPGNDLYRYEATGEVLEDLTADAADVNGADVKGVLEVSTDGKRVYFAANGDLDGGGPASAGNCKGQFTAGLNFSGQCSLYLAEETAPGDWSTNYIVRLDASGASERSDALNWVGRGGDADRFEKSALISADGSTLLFRSQRQLTPYDNEGHPELYRFQIGDSEIRCVSCNPTGEAPVGTPRLGSIGLSALFPQVDPASVLSRNLSADGKRVFFESSDPLVIDDTNGADGCGDEGATLFRFPSCQDVYEWEANGAGSCKEGAQSGGCLYLLSTGTSPNASFFTDASLSGDDVFIATRSAGLVGQDQDQLQDIFDLRVGGGLPSQSPSAKNPCESLDACYGAPNPPPASESPASEARGPGDKKRTRKATKKAHRKKHKHHKRAAKKTGGRNR